MDLTSMAVVRGLAPITIVVAHPDDEVIGLGGHLTGWPPPIFVHVTDGSPRDERDARAAGFGSASDYAAARYRELRTALACLPNPPDRFVRLGATDQFVVHELPDVIRRLAGVLRDIGPTVLLTHAYEGGHPDHDAVAFAVHALRARHDVPRMDVVEFAGYHEGPDGHLNTNRFPGSTSGGLRLALPSARRRLKRLMLGCFRTQQRVLRQFTCDEEWLRPAPHYDFTLPPNGGVLWYERFDWGVTGAEWQAAAASVADRLAREDIAC